MIEVCGASIASHSAFVVSFTLSPSYFSLWWKRIKTPYFSLIAKLSFPGWGRSIPWLEHLFLLTLLHLTLNNMCYESSLAIITAWACKSSALLMRCRYLVKQPCYFLNKRISWKFNWPWVWLIHSCSWVLVGLSLHKNWYINCLNQTNAIGTDKHISDISAVFLGIFSISAFRCDMLKAFEQTGAPYREPTCSAHQWVLFSSGWRTSPLRFFCHPIKFWLRKSDIWANLHLPTQPLST